jgi:hypothetical protein
MCYYETYILPASNKAEAYRHSILVSIFLNWIVLNSLQVSVYM